MRFKQFIQEIKDHPDFKDWSKGQDLYLANIFYMRTPQEKILQAGFYDKDTEKMASVSITDGALDIVEEKEVFKRPESEVQELVLADVSIEYEAMQEKLKLFIQEKYPKENLSKEIIILQKTELKDDIPIIWNVTYITESFKVLNIKMDATSGDILNHELRSIMEFRTNSPG